MFGEWIKERRLNKDYTLREFGLLIEEDPSNWSKIERNLIKAPTDKTTLEKIAKVLEISIDSTEFEEMSDLASISQGRIPEYITSNDEVMASLPAFLRTIGNIKPSSDELKQLIEIIKKEGI